MPEFDLELSAAQCSVAVHNMLAIHNMSGNVCNTVTVQLTARSSLMLDMQMQVQPCKPLKLQQALSCLALLVIFWTCNCALVSQYLQVKQVASLCISRYDAGISMSRFAFSLRVCTNTVSVFSGSLLRVCLVSVSSLRAGCRPAQLSGTDICPLQHLPFPEHSLFD